MPLCGVVARILLAGLLILIPSSRALTAADDAASTEEVQTCPVPEPVLPAAEIAKLEGKAFFDALSHFLVYTEDPPPEDLWVLVERCGREAKALDADRELGPDHSHRRYDCIAVVEDLVQAATAEELQRLLRVFGTIRPEGDFGRDLLDSVLNRRLVLAAGQLQRGVTPAKLDTDVPLPETSRAAPPEIRALWREYAALRKLYNDLLKTPAGVARVAVESHLPQFHRTVADFMADRITPAEAEEQLGRYYREGGDVVSPGAEDPQTKALLLSLIEQGRFDVAAGAALSMSNAWPYGRTLDGEPRIPAEVFERVLAAAGRDWERLAAISFLADRWAMARGAALALASSGSDHGAQALLELASLPLASPPPSQLAEEQGYLQALASFVEPSGRCHPVKDTTGRFARPVKRSAPNTATPQTEQRILDLLATRVEAGRGLEEASVGAALLHHLCRRESLPVFHSMLRSPYPFVQRVGHEGMLAFGQGSQDFTPAQPVTFRLLVGDAPAANRRAGYRLTWTDGGSMSTGLETDADGLATLDRGYFVDSKRHVASVKFSLAMTAEDDDKDDTPPLWGSVPSPSNLDAVTVVRLTAAPRQPR